MRLASMRQVFALIVLLTSLIAADATAAENPVLLNICPGNVGPCVTMDIGLVWADEPASSLDRHPAFAGADGKLPGEGEAVTAWFDLPVQQAGEHWRIQPVGLAAEYGAMQCDDGLLDVAVLGFEPDGDPVVLSDRGPLVLSRSTIVVGCPDCLAVLSTEGTAIAWHTTPSIEGDIDANGMLRPQSDGALLLERPDDCVQIFPDRRFRLVDTARCRVAPMPPLETPVAPAVSGALLDRWPGLNPEEIRWSLYGTDREDRIVFWLRQACT